MAIGARGPSGESPPNFGWSREAHQAALRHGEAYLRRLRRKGEEIAEDRKSHSVDPVDIERAVTKINQRRSADWGTIVVSVLSGAVLAAAVQKAYEDAQNWAIANPNILLEVLIILLGTSGVIYAARRGR